MPTIEALREAFPHLHMVDDTMLQSPFFHIGVLSSYLSGEARLRLSLEVIAEALRDSDPIQKVAA